ncbi:MAG: hypothetical protein ACP5MG_01885 [Verrucomicrobiia bacterium]
MFSEYDLLKPPCETILPVEEPKFEPPTNIVCPEMLESHLCEMPDGLNSSGNPNVGSACCAFSIGCLYAIPPIV